MVSLLCICCARENTARLVFEVTDPAASTVVVVCHTDINEIALDENGRGTCILDGIDAAYARVYYGPEMKRIYVEKGDKAKISFQGNDFNGTFLFKGRKAPAVEYLNTVELTAMPDETYAHDFGEFLSKTDRLGLIEPGKTPGLVWVKNLDADARLTSASASERII